MKSKTIKNDIVSILKEVNLGHHYFELAFMLHSSLFLNGVLFNTEALVNIKSKHVDQLMACEKEILCQIFECKRTVPIESLYIESSITPIKFILISRRLMFYWTILNKPKSELVRQTLDAMTEFPLDTDWLSLVRNDLSFLGIDNSEEYLKMATKTEMKQIIRDSIKSKKNEHLSNLQNLHSKSSKLKISDNIQEYLTSKRLSTPLKKFLFSLRSNMTSNKVNYKNKHSDLICRLCENLESTESLLHFTSCEFLILNISEVSNIHPGT